jgi:hypothetical protein
MKQQTLAVGADQGAGFEQYRRATKRDVFLATMNEIVPWAAGQQGRFSRTAPQQRAAAIVSRDACSGTCRLVKI